MFFDNIDIYKQINSQYLDEISKQERYIHLLYHDTNIKISLDDTKIFGDLLYNSYIRSYHLYKSINYMNYLYK